MIHRSSALCVLCAALGAGPAPAELTCPEPHFHAAQVRTGAALRHRFVVANAGGGAVQVTEVKSGCGCLKSAIDRRSLAPGERASVEVEVNTVTQAAGPNGWGVVVRYREGDREAELALHVTAELTPDVSIRPAALVVHTAGPIAHPLTLTERRDRPLEVRAAESSCPNVLARVEEPRRDGEGWKRTVLVEVLPDCPDGRHEGVVCLHTADAGCPELKVPFTVVKRTPGRVRPAPEAVDLVLSGDRPLPARIVLLGAGDGSAVLVERVEPAHPAIRCTFAAGPGPRSTLRVQVDRARLPEGPFESGVRVHLRQPAGEVVVVPVSVTR
jgi:hypothetical protein